MKRAAGLSLVLALVAGPAVAQGGGGGMRGGMAMADHWITADSLVKAVGADASVAAKIAPHLAEVDKILKTAADERAKRMAGGPPPAMDSTTRAAMMNQMQEWQKGIETHLGVVRNALPEASRAAFDALQKPRLGGGGRGGRMGGGPPPQ